MPLDKEGATVNYQSHLFHNLRPEMASQRRLFQLHRLPSLQHIQLVSQFVCQQFGIEHGTGEILLIDLQHPQFFIHSQFQESQVILHAKNRLLNDNVLVMQKRTRDGSMKTHARVGSQIANAARKISVSRIDFSMRNLRTLPRLREAWRDVFFQCLDPTPWTDNGSNESTEHSGVSNYLHKWLCFYTHTSTFLSALSLTLTL